MEDQGALKLLVLAAYYLGAYLHFDMAQIVEGLEFLLHASFEGDVRAVLAEELVHAAGLLAAAVVAAAVSLAVLFLVALFLI
jgi:hypothetical protein